MIVTDWGHIYWDELARCLEIEFLGKALYLHVPRHDEMTEQTVKNWFQWLDWWKN